MAVTVDRVKTFTAGEALAAYRRVKLSNASGTQVEYSDAGQEFIGITEAAAASGTQVAVRLWAPCSTFKATAAEAISVGDVIYGAADGKVADTPAGPAIGRALAAASADGSIIEVSSEAARRGVLYRNVAASAAHTNTTTEALFDKSYTVPANTLKPGDVLRVTYQGIATATNSTDTLTVKLYLGGLSGTAILTGTATDVANDNIFAGVATIVVRTIGATGTFVAMGYHTDVPAAAGTATIGITEIVASTAIDTTADQVIGVGADWSVANAGNSCRLDILIVEKL